MRENTIYYAARLCKSEVQLWICIIMKAALPDEVGPMRVVYGGDGAAVDGVEFVNFVDGEW